MRLLPAIDLKDGRCVRLLRGDFARETVYPAAPLELARKFAAMGADWLHVVDLDGAREGRTDAGNRALIAQLARESGLKLQVGGGLRSRSDVERVLEAGAGRAVIGSAALSEPDAARAWMQDFGCERIALAFDVRLDADGVPCIATHGWQRQSTRALWQALAEFSRAAPLHVLCTDVARDGALSGPNVALYAEAARRFPGIAWQASGGVRDAADLRALAACGAAAAISGKALLEELIPAEELRPFLPNA
jgi:phosphoribosylformimino-5-aminoimidazole carboxamide ribotide isomerase